MSLYSINNLSNMNDLKKFFVIILLCYATESIRAQESQGDPYQYNPSEKMFLPTPEQASLLKFTDIPPGNHTGVFGYSVPIYTIQGNDFSIPISIDYHGMGIKVDELSGSVGLGWALNIGGISLSEEVRGERDQGPVNRLGHFNPFEFDPFYDPSDIDDYMDARGMTAIGTPILWVPSAELQPDYFSYSLLNNKGKFILDNNDKTHTIPKDDVKIIGTQWFIDNKGLKYYFSRYQQEQGLSGYGGDGVLPRISYSYKIDSIVSPKTKEKIKFEYYPVSYKYTASHSHSMRYKIFHNFSTQGDPSGSNTFSTITEYLPKTIEYNRVKVEFKYKMNGSVFMNREDVSNGGAILEYIEVVDKLNPSQKIKNIKLTTDYFTSPSGELLPGVCGGTTGVSCSTLYKRLRLKKVEDLLSSADYGFEYIGETTNEVLPARFSYKTDYWGMYNGKTNSSGLPETVFEYNGTKYYLPGADKNPDEHFAKIGSLKKVKLPTGGSQIFEYELDEYKNTVFDDDNTVFHPVHDYEEREFQLDTSGGNILNQLLPITVPAPDYRAGFGYKLEFYYPCNPNNDLLGDQLPEADAEYYQLELYKGTTKIAQFFKDGTFPVEQLNPGFDYSLKIVKFRNPSCPVSSIYVKLSWIHDYVTYPPNRKAGTLRVKNITLNDSAGNPQIKRSYKYTNFDYPSNPNLSSGVFSGRSLESSYVSSQPSDQNGGSMSYLNVSNNGLYNLTSSFGKSVVYERVTETYESTDASQTSENHKKEYIFSLPIEATYGGSGVSPIVPTPHTDYSGGLLLEERIKNNTNQLVKVTENQYNHENPDTFFNQFSGNYYSPHHFALSPVLLAVATAQNPYSGFYSFNVKFTYIYSAWIKLLSTKVDEYENGTRVRTNLTEYSYNEGAGAQNEFKSILPVSVTTRTSMTKDDETYVEKLKTVYKYPQDLTGGTQGSLMQALKDANRISDPVKTEKFIIKSGTETKLSELHMKYGTNLLPSEVHFRNELGNIDINSTTDRKVRYSRYDINGNIEEFIMEDGTPVSIVWGYNKQFPIAKVEGVAYSVVQTYITNIVNDSNSDTTNCIGLSGCNEATLRVSLNTFRKQPAFSDALITTYTYDPLLGITSITQPNGQVEYYKYDSAGRLELIHDKDLKVLKNMRYNYKD